MRRFWYLTAAGGAVLLATLVSNPAYAASAVLTSGSPGGPATSGTVSAPLAPGASATFFEPGTTTGATCTTSTLSGTITSNPMAPGTATLNGNITFSNCTENIAGATCVQSVVTNGPFTVTVSSDGTVKVTGTIRATVKLCSILGTITCVYGAANDMVTGRASNADHSITFTNQQFNKVTGPSVCFSQILFSAKYAPIKDGSGQDVYVN
jgi:hypothetical protein